jgi:hypothetical protein
MPKGAKPIDIQGQQFGQLLALEFVGVLNHRSRWRCRCDCGTECVVNAKELRNGQTRSCGCRRVAAAKALGSNGALRIRHGHGRDGAASPTYVSWDSMIQRCTNQNNTRWKYYGGRGISVCERWLTFENFLADMGPRPAEMTIDRIDVNGNYEPANCRWADWATQVANKRPRKRSGGI